MPAEYRPIYWGVAVGIAGFLLFNIFLFTVLVTGVVVTIATCALLSLSDSFAYQSLLWRKAPWRILTLWLMIIAAPILYWGWRYQQAETADNASWQDLGANNLASAVTHAERATALFPYEENYWMLASGLHVQQAAGAQNSGALLRKAQREIDQAVAANPYIPQLHLNQGIIRYVGATDSATEQKGLTEMVDAVGELRWNRSFYMYAVQGLLNRSGGPAAEQCIDALIALAPDSIKSYVTDLKQQYAAAAAQIK